MRAEGVAVGCWDSAPARPGAEGLHRGLPVEAWAGVSGARGRGWGRPGLWCRAWRREGGSLPALPPLTASRWLQPRDRPGMGSWPGEASLQAVCSAEV